MPKLTVVIPTYNRPEYLAECLDSIAKQTFTDFDLYILDNASTSDYGPVLERYADMGFEYIRHAENIGAYANHAKAIEIAMSAEYAVVFHDDDLMHPRMLEWECAVLDGDDGLAWVASEDAAFENGKPIPYGVWDGAVGSAEVFDEPAPLVRLLLEGAQLNFGSVMYRSRVAAQEHSDTETFSSLADRPLLLEMAKRSRVALIREPLVLYRHHAGQAPYTTHCTSDHALALMRYYRGLLPAQLTGDDALLLSRHATNFLLYAYAQLHPSCRTGLSKLAGTASSQGLFRWRDIDGQGVGALARLARVDGAYARLRPLLSRIKGAVRR